MNNKNNFNYSKKTSTSIYYEKPSSDNPFVAESAYLYGYNLQSLVEKKTFIEVLLLLNTGKLPDKAECKLMNALMIGLINLGPRNPAVRASMTAAISKTNTAHLLPIGLMVLGGKENGATEIEECMIFIQKSCNEKKGLSTFLKSNNQSFKNGDIKVAPGIGSIFGQKCIISEKLADHIIKLENSQKHFKWLHQQLKSLNSSKTGWLPISIASAVFLDLGIKPREGIALFQLLCSPGIVAQALEQTHKPLSSMPFLEDQQYELEK